VGALALESGPDFVLVLMLTESFAPYMTWPLPIKKIKLQGRYEGITQNDPVFEDVIQAAWSDFNDKELFDEEEILLR
jgi:hypothetical protein